MKNINHPLKSVLTLCLIGAGMLQVTPVSAAVLLEFGFQVDPNPNPVTNTVTSYGPVTNNLTGTTPAPLITRPAAGAFSYNSDGWTGGSGNTMAVGGANPFQFTLAFDATGYTDFSIAFDYINESGSDYNFTSVQYRVGGVGGFTTIAGALTTLTGSGSGSGAGFVYTLDLTTLSAIENVSNVEIFFNGTSNVPNTIKADDFVLNGTAVPEPGTSLCFLIGLGFLLVVRRLPSPARA